MGSDILINRLTVAFGAGSDAAAVKNVTTRFFSGQVTGLIGESGSGKSVLGMSILRLLPSSARLSGAIEFDGENLLSLSAREMQALRGSRIGLIPQSPGIRWIKCCVSASSWRRLCWRTVDKAVKRRAAGRWSC